MKRRKVVRQEYETPTASYTLYGAALVVDTHCEQYRQQSKCDVVRGWCVNLCLFLSKKVVSRRVQVEEGNRRISDLPGEQLAVVPPHCEQQLAPHGQLSGQL